MGKKIGIVRHNFMINWSDLSLIRKVATIYMRCRHDFLFFIDTDSKIIFDIDSLFFQRKFKLDKKFASVISRLSTSVYYPLIVPEELNLWKISQ
jgi:hypothetical protein